MNEKGAAGQIGHKMARLPSTHRVSKRPLMHPAIAAPHSTDRKVMYISGRTPFMAAVKRCQKQLATSEKQRLRPLVDKLLGQSRGHGRDGLGIDKTPREAVYIRGAGKAIDKALKVGLFLMDTGKYDVRFTTGEVGTVDDIEEALDADEMDEDKDEDKEEAEQIPEMRLRMISYLEVAVSMR